MEVLAGGERAFEGGSMQEREVEVVVGEVCGDEGGE